MFYSDPISFYSTILEYRKADYARTVDWVLSQSAELLFKDAKALIYSADKGIIFQWLGHSSYGRTE